jgi:ubiquinone biosynthesis protein UbiJ
MLQGLQSLAGAAALERLTLLANHVLSAESAAVQRLRAHQGCCIRLQFDAWPALLPALPPTSFRVTPAGLLEWCATDAPIDADLRVDIDAANPALLLLNVLTGARPRVDVTGDALLAADVHWLFDNLRWDLEDDMARIVGPLAAHEIARVFRAVAAALRDAVGRVNALAARTGVGVAGPPAQ